MVLNNMEQNALLWLPVIAILIGTIGLVTLLGYIGYRWMSISMPLLERIKILFRRKLK